MTSAKVRGSSSWISARGVAFGPAPIHVGGNGFEDDALVALLGPPLVEYDIATQGNICSGGAQDGKRVDSARSSGTCKLKTSRLTCLRACQGCARNPVSRRRGDGRCQVI